MTLSTVKRYILPGLIFQSVVIAGGYGTGRELAEFFLSQGPLGGLLAIAVATTIWSAVCAISFELARLNSTFDYRTFFQQLLGRGWVLFEILYMLQLVIILAVIAAAAGAILEETFQLPYLLGVVGMMGAVGILVIRGSSAIEKFLTGWSVLLYAVYIVFFTMCFLRFGDDIVSAFSDSPTGNWALGGIEYAGYNLAVIPAVFFALANHRTRTEAIGAGLLAGPIAIIPGLLFFLAMAGQYPEILDRAVPANMLLEILGSRWMQIIFQVVLFGTLIETGTGLIHAINERISASFGERGQTMPGSARLILALVFLIIGALIAQFGIIGLIAQGYGTLTWGFVVVFVSPVLTVGLYRITIGLRSRQANV